MKDLEKIKSEDLAAQVQDANPGNFAIEQEVAQLVGATVPAPTEPSADDARELGAQLLVFLRRALLPIRSVLRTAVAAIYAHLDSRCTDYTPAGYAPYIPRPYDPMRPLTPRTLPNLLTAITAFSARKISNGSAPNDGIPDGTSLAHLLCDNAATKIVDDNRGWTCSKSDVLKYIANLFPSMSELTIGCKEITASLWNIGSNSSMKKLVFAGLEKSITSPLFVLGNNGGDNVQIEEMEFPDLEKIGCLLCYSSNGWWIAQFSALSRLTFPKLKELTSAGGGRGAFIEIPCPSLKVLDLSAVTAMNRPLYGGSCLEGLEELWLTNSNNVNLCHGTYPANISTKLLLIDIKQGFNVNLNLTYWNPTDKGTTFLQNFREHIALRLTANGSGLTLTLSQAVFDTIWNQDGTPKSTDPDSVIYQINKIIKTDKHWSVNRA